MGNLLSHKKAKMGLIKAVFIIPLVVCGFTGIWLKSFLEAQEVAHQMVLTDALIMLELMIFINAVASFSALLCYYCLEGKVGTLIRKPSRKVKKVKNILSYAILEEDVIDFFSHELDKNISRDYMTQTPKQIGIDSLDYAQLICWAEEKYGIKFEPTEYDVNTKLETLVMTIYHKFHNQ